VTRDGATYNGGTALLVVDVQNDFVDPKGSLSVRGGTEVVDPINRAIVAARDAGAVVVYTQDWHPAHTPHFERDGGIWPVHCVAGTWGAEMYPRLEVVEGETIHKGVDGRDGYSAFSVRHPETGETEPTRLEAILRERGIERVVVAGLATDYCVVETVVDARRLGFDAEVLTVAIRAVDLEPGDGDHALRRMREAGATLLPETSP
jgi:nicotinamidase/pyrazinamidase